MSKIAVNEITDEQGSGRPSFTNGVQTSNINGGQVGGRRNLIINGAMQVAQRGTSVTFTGQDFDYGWVDRWTCSFNSTSTYEQVSTSMDTFEYATRITLGSGESGSQIRQKIETPAHISFKTLTLSWYAKASAELDQYVYVTREDGPQPYDYFEPVFSEQVTTEWQRFSATFTVGYDVTNKNYSVQLGISNASSGDTYDITGVQLEVGDTATEFEHRSYGEELALCQRYYEKFVVDGGTSFTMGANQFNSSCHEQFNFNAEKRVTPTVSSSNDNWASFNIYNGSNQNGLSSSVSAQTTKYFFFNVQNLGAYSVHFVYNNGLDWIVEADAEL